MKSLSIYIINGLVVAITESTRILSNSLVAFYSPHGKVSVRRKVGSDVKCDMTAHRLNGGDHIVMQQE